MDYQTLFKTTDMLDGGDNFRCRHYLQAGIAEFTSRSCYPILFVLQGAIEIRWNYNRCRVPAGNLVVVDAKTLSEFRVEEGTIIMSYRSPLRLEDVFKHCSQIYDEPYSETVPISPMLREWIDRLLEKHMQGMVWIDRDAHEQRRELARVLMTYPRRELGELYAAFSACALGDCEKCRQRLLEDANASTVCKP